MKHILDLAGSMKNVTPEKYIYCDSAAFKLKNVVLKY